MANDALLIEAARRGLIKLPTVSDADIDPTREAPAGVRAVVAGREGADKLATLQKFYPDAQPYGDGNFVFTDPETNRPTIYNRESWLPTLGDVAALTPLAAEMVGGAVGASAGAGMGGGAGAAGGPAAAATVPAGAVAGSMIGMGAGAAAGRAAYDLFTEGLLGATDTRTPLERTRDYAVTGFVNALLPKVVEKAVGGVKAAVGAGVNRLAGAPSDEIMSAFAAESVTPTAGAVTGSKGIQSIEDLLSKFAPSAGVMAKKFGKTVDEAQAAVERLAGRYGDAGTPVEAGLALQRGAKTARDRFFDDVAPKAYAEVDRLIPKDTPVGLDNTLSVLTGLTDEFASNPELGKLLTPGKYVKLRDAILDEAGNIKPLTWNELKLFRTRIGEDIKELIVNDANNAQLKALYGALTRDLEAAAKAQGPEALSAFQRASTIYARGLEMIEGQMKDFLKPGGTAESAWAAFNAAAQGKSEGVRQIAVLRRQMPEGEWGDVAAYVLRRLGQARPGSQNAAGDAFSFDTFLTNYAAIPEKTRTLIFGGSRYAGLDDSLERLATIAASIKDRANMINNSRTAGQIANFAWLTSPFAAGGVTGGVIGQATGGDPMTGFVAGATLAGATGAAANAGARLVTSPAFMAWLVRAAGANSVSGLTKELGRLAGIAEAEPRIREAVALYLSDLRAVQPSPRSEYMRDKPPPR